MMNLQVWALVLSAIGILATAGIGIFFHVRTVRMTRKLQDFLVMVILNSAPNPRTLQRLLDDYNKTGAWRGTIEQIPSTNDYRIAWNPQFIQVKGMPSEDSVGKPTLIQGPPKSDKQGDEQTR